MDDARAPPVHRVFGPRPERTGAHDLAPAPEQEVRLLELLRDRELGVHLDGRVRLLAADDDHLVDARDAAPRVGTTRGAAGDLEPGVGSARLRDQAIP